MAPAPIEARLAEFAALRAEVINLRDAQRLLFNLNVTAAAGLATLSVARPGNAGLMVVLAFLSPTLGLVGVRNRRGIERIGRYIGTELWKDWEPGWQRWLAEEHRRRPRRLLLDPPIVDALLFLGPAVAGLVVSAHHQGEIGGPGVWWLALVVTTWFCVIAGVEGVMRRVRRRRGA